MLTLPLTNREIPLIADDYAKPEFGSGAVKVTPAHDLNDFECGLRHNLPRHIVIGKDGKMTPLAGEEFEGLDRFVARKLVLTKMEELDLIEKIEDYTIQQPVSDRSKEIIEPLLSEQWFVDMKPLAEPAIAVAKQGKVRFIPERYKDIYLHWMENIRPWCISRQLWWGHRIPVFWTDDPNAMGGNLDEITGNRHAFARTQEEAIAALGTEKCWQDEDVLDTWFSSALWPHATLGWPQNTADLDYFYPTNLLSTAQEILYLWVARMIMTGLDFVKRSTETTSDSDGLVSNDGSSVSVIPFRDVYIHATVLDEKGVRMSKTRGNGIDPIDLIDQFGADATRFSLLQQAGKNQDIKFSMQRPEIAGQFCNKLWNASRFVLMNLDSETTGELPSKNQQTLPDHWILHRLNQTIGAVNSSLSTYDMDDATRAVYQFFWNDFCDWYVEMAKTRLREGGESQKIAQNMLAFVLEKTLCLMHPMIPFITEEIWQALPHKGETLIIAPYPEIQPNWENNSAEQAISTTIEATRSLRNLRAELGIAPGIRLKSSALPSRSEIRTALSETAALIADLARLESLEICDSAPSAESGKWIGTPIEGAEVFLEIGDSMDMQKERDRIEKEIASIAKEIEKSNNKLGNANFVDRAKPEIVEEERQRLLSWQEKLSKLEERKRLFS